MVQCLLSSNYLNELENILIILWRCNSSFEVKRFRSVWSVLQFPWDPTGPLHLVPSSVCPVVWGWEDVPVKASLYTPKWSTLYLAGLAGKSLKRRRRSLTLRSLNLLLPCTARVCPHSVRASTPWWRPRMRTSTSTAPCLLASSESTSWPPRSRLVPSCCPVRGPLYTAVSGVSAGPSWRGRRVSAVPSVGGVTTPTWGSPWVLTTC